MTLSPNKSIPPWLSLRLNTREYFIAPIDKCYELVGTIRIHWRGLSGGEEGWRQIEKFFARLRGS